MLTRGPAASPVGQHPLVPGYPIQRVEHAAVPPLLVLRQLSVSLETVEMEK